MPHPWGRVLRAGPPSIPAVLFITLAIFVPIVLQQPMLNSDGDLARHLRHGPYMLEHRGLIRADPYSYTRAGAPFVEASTDATGAGMRPPVSRAYRKRCSSADRAQL